MPEIPENFDEACDGGLRTTALFGSWMPIETAPKSSRAVLIHCAERKNTYAAENGTGTWRVFGGWVGIHEVPTHWMPLPSPPNA